MNLLKTLFGLSAPVDRRTYLVTGLALALLKYGVDFAVVYLATGKYWSLLGYLSPVLVLRSEMLRPAPEMLLWGMAAYALPFAWVGLSMSVRRAADAGMSPWFGVLFLLPGVNWLVILVLSLRPTLGTWAESDDHPRVPLRLRTALASVGFGVALSGVLLERPIGHRQQGTLPARGPRTSELRPPDRPRAIRRSSVPGRGRPPALAPPRDLGRAAARRRQTEWRCRAARGLRRSLGKTAAPRSPAAQRDPIGAGRSAPGRACSEPMRRGLLGRRDRRVARSRRPAVRRRSPSERRRSPDEAPRSGLRWRGPRSGPSRGLVRWHVCA